MAEKMEERRVIYTLAFVVLGVAAIFALTQYGMLPLQGLVTANALPPVATITILSPVRGSDYIMYDPEHWDMTPLSEQNNMVATVASAAQIVHTAGFKMAFVPDKGFFMNRDPASKLPLYQLYDYSAIDLVVIQAENNQDPARFAPYVPVVVNWIKSHNPNTKVMIEVGLVEPYWKRNITDYRIAVNEIISDLTTVSNTIDGVFFIPQLTSGGDNPCPLCTSDAAELLLSNLRPLFTTPITSQTVPVQTLGLFGAINTESLPIYQKYLIDPDDIVANNYGNFPNSVYTNVVTNLMDVSNTAAHTPPGMLASQRFYQGANFNFRFGLSCLRDACLNVSAKIFLPPGMTLSGSDTYTIGNLDVNQIGVTNWLLKSDSPGSFNVTLKTFLNDKLSGSRTIPVNVAPSPITVCAFRCNSTTIQGAINMAAAGNEVRIIDSEEYDEFVVVNSSITLTSNSSKSPIVFSQSFLPAVRVAADGVTISNLKIVQGRTGPYYALNINNTQNTTIFKNTIVNGIYGNTRYSNIVGNNVITSGTNSVAIGMNLLSTSFSTISRNIISGTATDSPGTPQGIYLYRGSSNVISRNSVSTSSGFASRGMYVFFGSNNTIIDNFISTFGKGSSNIGIATLAASGNNIIGNEITTSGLGNNNFALLFDSGSTSSGGNLISGNMLSTSGLSTNDGIRISSNSNNNVVTDNVITTNGMSYSNFGVSMWWNTGNLVSGNMITTNGTDGGNDPIFINGNLASGNTVSDNILYTDGTSTASYNYDAGIAITNGPHDNIFSNNNITVNSVPGNKYGIIFSSGLSPSMNNIIKDSSISAPSGSDIVDSNLLSGGSNFILNSSFQKSRVNTNSTSSVGKVFIQWDVGVRVVDINGAPVSGATVTGNDNPANVTPVTGFAAITDSSGFIPQQALTEIVSSSGNTYVTNYTIKAVTPSLVNHNSTQINPKSNMIITIVTNNCTYPVNNITASDSCITQAFQDSGYWKTLTFAQQVIAQGDSSIWFGGRQYICTTYSTFFDCRGIPVNTPDCTYPLSNLTSSSSCILQGFKDSKYWPTLGTAQQQTAQNNSIAWLTSHPTICSKYPEFFTGC